MEVQVGQIWAGQQRAHPWRVRVCKCSKQGVLVEVIAGPSHSLKRRIHWRQREFIVNYTLL